MNDSQPERSVSSDSPPSLAFLFTVCFKIGMSSFGGAISGWLYREFVEKHRLVGDEDFASMFALCQMLPGANAVNLAVCIGNELRGPGGVVACFFGLLLGPILFVIGISALFQRLSAAGQLQSVTAGVAFAALGLMVVICWRGIQRTRSYPPFFGVIAVTAVGVGVLQWSLLLTVALIAPISVWMSWRRL